MEIFFSSSSLPSKPSIKVTGFPFRPFFSYLQMSGSRCWCCSSGIWKSCSTWSGERFFSWSRKSIGQNYFSALQALRESNIPMSVKNSRKHCGRLLQLDQNDRIRFPRLPCCRNTPKPSTANRFAARVQCLSDNRAPHSCKFLGKQQGILKALKRFFKSPDGVNYTAAFKNLSTKKSYLSKIK